MQVYRIAWYPANRFEAYWRDEIDKQAGDLYDDKGL